MMSRACPTHLLFATPWGFSRQEYWSRLSCHPPGDLSNPATEPRSSAGGFFIIWATREAQEYWSGLPIPSPVDLPNPGVEPGSPTLQADSLPAEPQGKPKNTGVGCLSLLQWICPTQESNQCFLHCRQILYQLSHWGNPRILEWVAYPFSRGSSWSRNQTGVSCTAGEFFTNWAVKEAFNT